MAEAILNTNTLPSPIRERFSTTKISVRSHEDGVILLPFKDIRAYRGISKGSSFTTDTILTDRREEQSMENKDQRQ